MLIRESKKHAGVLRRTWDALLLVANDKESRESCLRTPGRVDRVFEIQGLITSKGEMVVVKHDDVFFY